MRQLVYSKNGVFTHSSKVKIPSCVVCVGTQTHYTVLISLLGQLYLYWKYHQRDTPSIIHLHIRRMEGPKDLDYSDFPWRYHTYHKKGVAVNQAETIKLCRRPRILGYWTPRLHQRQITAEIQTPHDYSGPLRPADLLRGLFNPLTQKHTNRYPSHWPS